MHWTYEATEGRLLVTDLQGWQDDANSIIRLTDPAVLCREIGQFDDLETKEWWLVRRGHECHECMQGQALCEAMHA